MSELLKKYESIDQSKLNEATIKIINRVKTITADFTADDEKNNKIAEQVLDSVMQKNPDAVKIVKREPKAKPAPKKTHKATHTAKKAHTAKATHTTSSAPKTSNNIMSVAKEIQKAGESWKDAMERAKEVLKERRGEVVQKQKTELEKLYNLVKTKKELQGFANSDIKRDAVREAKVKGARFVSKEGSTSNAYGTFPNKIGRKYWETRDRHSDRLAPNYPKDMPLLASGGGFEKEEEYLVTLQNSETGELTKLNVLGNSEQNAIDNAFTESDLNDSYEFHSVKKMAKGGGVDYYEQLAVYVQGEGSIYNGTSMKKAIDKANSYLKNNPKAEIAIVDEKYGDEYDLNGNLKEEYANGGEVESGKIWDLLSKEQKGNFITKYKPEIEENLKLTRDIIFNSTKNDNWDILDENIKNIFKKHSEKKNYYFENIDKKVTWEDYQGNKIKGVIDGVDFDGNYIVVGNEDYENDVLNPDEVTIKDNTKKKFWLFSNGGSFANGGMTEHGLKRRDKILFGVSGNVIEVESEDGENYLINLNTGQRINKKDYTTASSQGRYRDFFKMADGGSLPFMTDPNFGNFQNTGSFADGGSMSDLTEQEFLKKYFGANVFTENPSQYFEIKKMSSSDDNKVDAFVKELKADGFTVKKRAFSDFTSVMGVKKKASFELGGAFMNTDLAGHTGGGTGGLNANVPLDGFSGTNYTGLVGETGAMSSGELFEAGGAMMQNQQVINDASQSYVNYYLGEGASQGIYKDGGSIPNNYEGRIADDVWENWTESQRSHFLLDHSELLDNDRMENNLGYTRTVQKDKLFSELTPFTKRVLEAHIRGGQYAYGGKTKSAKPMKELYIEQIASLTGTRTVGVEKFVDDNNLNETELSNLMTGLGRGMISRGDFVTALTGEKGNSIQKEVVAFAKSDKAYKMADGGFTPDVSDGTQFMSGVYANGGGIRSKEELDKIFSEKEAIVKNLTPSQIAKMWNENSFGVKEGISKPITIEEAKRPSMKMYLENLLIENELTEEEQAKYFADGGSVDNSVVNELWNGYASALLFTETDSDSGEPLDSEYSISDFDKETVTSTKKMLADYYSENKDAIEESELDLDTIGNDIWYTRSGQGAGFFDHNLDEEVEEKLINSAKALGEYPSVETYDGKISVRGGKVFAKGGSVDNSVVNELWNGYASALLFTETDSDSGEPLDSEYSISDFDKETVTSTKKMLADYYSENKDAIEESELDLDTIGNDIWYTRSGQGAGFFDHNLDEEVEEKLINSAKALGEYPSVETYDGKISVRGGKVFAKGGGVSGARFKFDIGDKVMIDDRGYVTSFSEFDLSKPAEIIDRSTTKMGGKTYYFYKVKMADGRVAFNQAEQSKLTLVEKGSFAKGGFVGTVEFNVGDVVWDKGNKTYGTVMNNFGDPINGNDGELRLDSDGMQVIFSYDKDYKNRIGYNLVKLGDKGDAGKFTPVVLDELKRNAESMIKYGEREKDKEKIKYYKEIYKRTLDGEFDSMVGRAKATASTKKGSSDYTYVPNKDVKELSVVVKGELKKLMGSDILDGVYVKDSAKSAPKVDANAVFAKILKDAKEAKDENGKSKRFEASDLKKINLQMVQKLVEAGYTEQQIRNVILGYAFDNEIVADNEFEYDSGIFGYEPTDMESKINDLVEAQKNKEFAIGFEYPNFDWKSIIKKYKISTKPKEISYKKNLSDGSYYEYFYQVFVGEKIAFTHNLGYKRFDKNGKLEDDYIEKSKVITDLNKLTEWQKERDYTAGFNGGYWYVVSSKIEVIDDIIKTLVSQKDGYCKDLVDIYSDSFTKTLKENKIEFANGGFMSGVYAKGGVLNKKVNDELNFYLGDVINDVPMSQWIIKTILKSALTDANFHNTSKEVDSIFTKAKYTESAQFSKLQEDAITKRLESKGRDIAKMCDYDAFEIIDSIAFYVSMNMGRPLGEKIENLKNIFADGGSTDEVAKIKVSSPDGKYVDVWYITKDTDTTHFYISNSPESKGMAYHVGQFRSEVFYDDLRSWLKGGSNIDGNEYKSNSYANGGSFEDNYGFMRADNENNYRFPERPVHVDTLDEPIDLTDNVSYKSNEVVIEPVDQEINMNEDGRIRARMTQSNRGSAENFAKINPNSFEFIPMPTSNKHKND